MRSLPLWFLLAACHLEPGANTSTGGGTPAGETSATGCRANHPNWTVGLLQCSPDATPGYTLFTPLLSGATYLVDLQGELVHSWESGLPPGESVYLEPSGHLLRTAESNQGTPFHTGGAGGRIQEFDWDGNLVWEFVYASQRHLTHHDVERMPDGHVLAIAWELYDSADAIALGRDPGSVPNDGLWATHLIEIDPATDDIVWEWFMMDHVVQDRDPTAANYGALADNPHLVDIDRSWMPGPETDWNHTNAIDYNADLDQIVISARFLDEIFVIDHATGEIVYRWGTPENYGMPGPKQLSNQHDVEWIGPGLPGEGNLLVYNNGGAWGYSRVFEIETPVQPDGSYARDPGQPWGPDAPTWTHGEPGDFFSGFVSGSQRLPSGNTLICEGDAGRFFEVTPEGETVWEYVNPVGPSGPVKQGTEFVDGGVANAVFRADRYAPDYPAFDGRDLMASGTIQR